VSRIESRLESTFEAFDAAKYSAAGKKNQFTATPFNKYGARNQMNRGAATPLKKLGAKKKMMEIYGGGEASAIPPLGIGANSRGAGVSSLMIDDDTHTIHSNAGCAAFTHVHTHKLSTCANLDQSRHLSFTVCVAVCCSELQCVAVCCSVLR